MSFDSAGFAAAFPWFFPSLVFVLGAVVGSFLNVVIHRVPRGESIVTPGSHCACGASIAWHDNIPILSWFLMRGRARCCGRSYGFRYPLIEALTAALFLVAWLQHPPAVAGAGFIFVSVLVGAFFIDVDHMIIPDALSVGGAVAGLILSIAVPALHGFGGSELFTLAALRSGFASLLGLLVGSALLLWIAILAEAVLRKEAMGFGDVKLVGMIGAFCGWQGAVFAIFGGAVVGTIWIALAATWQKLAGQRSPFAPPTETPEGAATELRFGAHIPFGPMLAIAGALYFLLAAPWVDTYLGELAAVF